MFRRGKILGIPLTIIALGAAAFFWRKPLLEKVKQLTSKKIADVTVKPDV